MTDPSTAPTGRSISGRSFKVALTVVLTLALVVRVAVAVHYGHIPPQTDAVDYDRHAVSIADGDGYPEALEVTGGPGPTAFRPPLYPFVLAGVYKLSGTSDQQKRWDYARIAQAVVGTLVVALVALIGLQLLGRREALVAAAIAAIYPPLILAGSTFLTEPLFTALILAGIAAILHYRGGDDRLRWLFVAGALAGLATLTRTNGVTLIALLALGAWTVRPRFSRRAVVAPAAAVAASVVVIAPWTIRNAVELDAFVPVSTQAGYALAGQHNRVAAENRAEWIAPFRVPDYRPLFTGEHLGEVELTDRLGDRAKDYALDHPDDVVAAAFWNTLRMLYLDDPVDTERSVAFSSGQPQGLAEVSIYAFWLLVLLAIAGCLVGAARRIPSFLWLLPILLLISPMFVVGLTRYRVPADPLLVLLAAFAVTWAWTRLSSRSSA